MEGFSETVLLSGQRSPVSSMNFLFLFAMAFLTQLNKSRVTRNTIFPFGMCIVISENPMDTENSSTSKSVYEM